MPGPHATSQPLLNAELLHLMPVDQRPLHVFIHQVIQFSYSMRGFHRYRIQSNP